MPVTQVVPDNLRNRSFRSRIICGPSRTAALTTLAVLAASSAGLSTWEFAHHDATAGRPALTAYLISATTSNVAHADGGPGGTGGSVSITFTVSPSGTGSGGTGSGGTGSGGTGSGGTGSGGTGPPGSSGDFTVTVQAGTVTLRDIGVSGVATGVIQTITVSDTRSWAPGWSVRGQESDFTGKHGARPRTIPGTALGWVPTGTLARGAELGSVVDPGRPGIGDAGPVLAAANPGLGLGTSSLSAELTLAVPASARTGTYSGLLTITYLETASLPASSGSGQLAHAR